MLTTDVLLQLLYTNADYFCLLFFTVIKLNQEKWKHSLTYTHKKRGPIANAVK